jgi:hypothetical protein
VSSDRGERTTKSSAVSRRRRSGRVEGDRPVTTAEQRAHLVTRRETTAPRVAGSIRADRDGPRQCHRVPDAGRHPPVDDPSGHEVAPAEHGDLDHHGPQRLRRSVRARRDAEPDGELDPPVDLPLLTLREGQDGERQFGGELLGEPVRRAVQRSPCTGASRTAEPAPPPSGPELTDRPRRPRPTRPSGPPRRARRPGHRTAPARADRRPR